jgi:hypothetical protein
MSEPKTENERNKFPELKQKDGLSNYGSWAAKAKSRLTNLDLWEIVGGNKIAPYPGTEGRANNQRS